MSAEFQLLFSYSATVAMPPEVIGEVPEGLRVHFYFSGGDITGDRCHGTVLPVGADWLLVRRDGVGIVDARSTIKTHDGALIYMTMNGIVDFGPMGYENVIHGNLPPHIPIRTAPRFETSHPDYLWMNRMQGYGVGLLEPAFMSFDVFGAEAAAEENSWMSFDEPGEGALPAVVEPIKTPAAARLRSSAVAQGAAPARRLRML